MFELPPFRTKAIATLAGIAFVILYLAKLFDPTKPFPKTVPSALLLALFVCEWVAICFGTLCSQSFRNWLYEPVPNLEQQLEKLVPVLLIVGIITTMVAGSLVYRAWEIAQIGS
jgi:hypothetical protein